MRRNLRLGLVVDRRKKGDRLFDVVLRVEGTDRMGGSPFLFGVAFLLEERVFFLNVRRIAQNQFRQIERGGSAVNFPAESVQEEFR